MFLPHANGSFDVARRDVLEQLASGASLEKLLTSLALHIEARNPGAMCSVLLFDAERRVVRHGAAPHLPEDYSRAIDGLPIGPSAGSCGTAAYRGERVIVTDIATDPLWKDYAEIALPYGLRACWSSPILSPERAVLGTFALYYGVPRAPKPDELALIDEATSVAAVVIQRDRMEQRVRAEEGLRAVVYQNVSDVIFYLAVEPGGTFRFLSVNQAFTKATGLHERDIIGRGVHDIIAEPSLSYVVGRYHEAIRTKAPVTWEEVTQFPSGTKYGEVSVSPVFDAKGVCTNLIGTVHDATARKKADEERRQLEDQLRQSQRLQSLGTLAGGIAHDFNNILTAIRGYTGVALEEVPADSAVAESLVEIERASKRATELIKRILMFSRRDTPQRVRLSVPTVVEEALSLIRASFKKSTTIRTHFAPDAPDVSADPTQLHQIVMNFATNAGHAMGSTGGTLTVSVDRVVVDDSTGPQVADLESGVYARLSVADTGRGMDRATLARVFEPFFSTKPAGEGTGLGLSVVHGIVKSHGGAITVDSTPGVGTTFTVYLPAAEAAVEAVPNTSYRRSVPIGRAIARLLIVDDDDPLLLLARRVLKRRQYDVTTHNDAAAALALFRSEPDAFDAIIADVSMPVISGVEFAREVLALRPNIPFILVSGYAEPAVTQTAAELGIRGVVTKPYTAEQYADLLEPFINATA